MLLRKLLVLLLCSINWQVLLAEVPHIFAPNEPADAEEVNANFDALVTQIEQLQASVGVMQSLVNTPTVADTIPGTYDFVELAIEAKQNGDNDYGIGGSSSSGTVVLNVDGTGTVNSTDSNSSLNFFTQTKSVRTGGDTCCETVDSTSVHPGGDSSSDSGSFTWTYSGNVLTVTDEQVMTFISAGGRIFVHQGYEADEGRNSIVIVIRR